MNDDYDDTSWDALDQEDKASWERNHPDPLRVQFYVNKDDIRQTNMNVYDEFGGSSTDDDGDMLEYLNDTSENTSGIAKITIDLNIWQLCEVEFNDGERCECYYDAHGGYVWGEKIDLKECPMCGKMFSPNRKGAPRKTCSDRCRQRKKRAGAKTQEKVA